MAKIDFTLVQDFVKEREKEHIDEYELWAKEQSFEDLKAEADRISAEYIRYVNLPWEEYLQYSEKREELRRKMLTLIRAIKRS